MTLALKQAKHVHQEVLVQQLRCLFPNEKTYTNSREASQIYAGDILLELDIWIPNLKLSFEFQDEHHYVNTWYNTNSTNAISQRDYIKQETTLKEGITLAVIPCWWAGDQSSLAATINFQRPDLLNIDQCFAPIPLNPPLNYFVGISIPHVGELMYASFPSHPKIVSQFAWWIGEKYDGIRCCWNPKTKKVYSRGGNEFVLLDSYIPHMPSSFTDSEFWFGRGEFLYTYPLVVQNIVSVFWHILRMITFDTPENELQQINFETRYEHILHSISEINPFIIVAPRIKSEETQKIEKISQMIIEDGGEGVILRERFSKYECGRSSSLIKLKTTAADREGIVIAVDEKLTLRLPNGITFSVEKENVNTHRMPIVGEIVSFSFDNNARREIPTNPKIFRIRSDLSWDDVCYSAANDNQGFVAQAQRYWNAENMRTHMENFARSRNLDPLLAETWYGTPDEIFYKDKGGRIIAQKFGGFSHAVQNLFPEIDFSLSSFLLSWKKMTNRRKFFEEYARENNFDPLVATNWYTQSKDRIYNSKEGARVMYYHNDNVTQALLDLFPEIGLEKYKLSPSWHKEEERRKFFENYALKVGFDPLLKRNWYQQSRENIMSAKGAKRVMFYHENNIAKALIDLFPDLDLDRSKLLSLMPSSRSSWEDITSRRELFVKYAKDNNFDPLLPDNWYKQPRKKILEIRGTATVISYYDYSMARALLDCFPDIGLEIAKFPWNRSVWYYPKNRRQFFETLAAENGFDLLDPEAWHTLSREKLLATKGASHVLSYHSGSLFKALSDLFPEVNLKPAATINATTRRQALERFARQRGFDPLHADAWYKIDRANIVADSELSSILDHYNRSATKALLNLFPDIGLNAAKFSWASPAWNNEIKRRQFFENYAQTKGFDPHNAESWYLQPLDNILSLKGITNVISYHKRSLPQALIDLFPNIGLEKARLWPAPSHSIENSRKFFENFAKENNFDPHSADEWAKRSRQQLGAWPVLAFHKNNFSKALRACFPNIGLKKSKNLL